MKEKDIPMESQVVTLGDEFLKVMLEEIQKNTTAITDNNGRIAQVSTTMEALVKMKERMDAVEKELVFAKEVLTTVKTVVERPGVSPEQIKRLQAELFALTAFFERPLKKEIHHKHFLGWPVVVVCVLMGVTGFCLTIMGIAVNRADRYMENDIKWRYAKLIKDSALLLKLDSAEEKYEGNPDEFMRYVTGEERRRQKLVEKELEKEGTQDEIDKLKKKEKKF